MALQVLTRPYESILLVLSVLLFFLPVLRKLASAVPVLVLVVVPAIAITLLQDKEVTGSWTNLPYLLSRYQYGVPPTFTFQPNPVPHRALTVEQDPDHLLQVAVDG